MSDTEVQRPLKVNFPDGTSKVFQGDTESIKAQAKAFWGSKHPAPAAQAPAPKVTRQQIDEFRVKFFNTYNPEANAPMQAAHALAKNSNDPKWRPALGKMSPIAQYAIAERAKEIREEPVYEAPSNPAGMGAVPTYRDPQTGARTETPQPHDIIGEMMHGPEGYRQLKRQQGAMAELTRTAESVVDPASIAMMLGGGVIGATGKLGAAAVTAAAYGMGAKGAYDKAKEGDYGGAAVDALLPFAIHAGVKAAGKVMAGKTSTSAPPAAESPTPGIGGAPPPEAPKAPPSSGPKAPPEPPEEPPQAAKQPPPSGQQRARYSQQPPPRQEPPPRPSTAKPYDPTSETHPEVRKFNEYSDKLDSRIENADAVSKAKQRMIEINKLTKKTREQFRDLGLASNLISAHNQGLKAFSEKFEAATGQKLNLNMDESLDPRTRPSGREEVLQEVREAIRKGVTFDKAFPETVPPEEAKPAEPTKPAAPKKTSTAKATPPAEPETPKPAEPEQNVSRETPKEPEKPKSARYSAFDESKPAEKPSVAVLALKPPQLHGTSRAFTPGSIYGTDQYKNLYGPGLYTTDSMDIAQSYTKKGGGKEPAIYRVEHIKSNPNLLDLEKPLPSDVYKMMSAGDYGYGMKPEMKGTELYRQLKDNMANDGLTVGEAEEEMHGLVYELQQRGYDGYRHIGGQARGGSIKHNVEVYFAEPVHGTIPAKFKGVSDPTTITPEHISAYAKDGMTRAADIYRDMRIADPNMTREQFAQGLYEFHKQHGDTVNYEAPSGNLDPKDVFTAKADDGRSIRYYGFSEKTGKPAETPSAVPSMPKGYQTFHAQTDGHDGPFTEVQGKVVDFGDKNHTWFIHKNSAGLWSLNEAETGAGMGVAQRTQNDAIAEGRTKFGMKNQAQFDSAIANYKAKQKAAGVVNPSASSKPAETYRSPDQKPLPKRSSGTPRKGAHGGFIDFGPLPPKSGAGPVGRLLHHGEEVVNAANQWDAAHVSAQVRAELMTRNVLPKHLTDVQKDAVGEWLVGNRLYYESVNNPDDKLKDAALHHSQYRTPAQLAALASDPAVKDAIEEHRDNNKPVIDKLAKSAGVHAQAVDSKNPYHIRLLPTDYLNPGSQGFTTSSGGRASWESKARPKSTGARNKAQFTGKEYSTDVGEIYRYDLRDKEPKARLNDLWRTLDRKGLIQVRPRGVANWSPPEGYTGDEIQGKYSSAPPDIVSKYGEKATVYLPKDVVQTMDEISRPEGPTGHRGAEIAKRVSRMLVWAQLGTNPMAVAGHLYRQAAMVRGATEFADVKANPLKIVGSALTPLGVAMKGAVIGFRDFDDPIHQQVLQDLVEANAVSPRSMEVKDFDKMGKLAKYQHMLHDAMFGMPRGRGVNGWAIRAAVEGEIVRRRYEKNKDPERMRAFAQNFGRYTRRLSPHLGTLAQLNPFVRTTYARYVASVKQMGGVSGLKAPGGASAQAGQWLGSFALKTLGVVTGLVVINRALSGKWPWENDKGHEIDINLGSGHYMPLGNFMVEAEEGMTLSGMTSRMHREKIQKDPGIQSFDRPYKAPTPHNPVRDALGDLAVGAANTATNLAGNPGLTAGLGLIGRKPYWEDVPGQNAPTLMPSQPPHATVPQEVFNYTRDLVGGGQILPQQGYADTDYVHAIIDYITQHAIKWDYEKPTKIQKFR